MTPAELKAEIQSGPLAAELAPLWSTGNDSGVAAALNRKDRAGYVPARAVLAAILSDTTGFGADLLWLRKYGTTIDGTLMTTAKKRLVIRLFSAIELSDYQLKFPPAELSAGCDVLGAPDAVKAAILAAEVKVNRAEELGWGGVSDFDVAKARGT